MSRATALRRTVQVVSFRWDPRAPQLQAGAQPHAQPAAFLPAAEQLLARETRPFRPVDFGPAMRLRFENLVTDTEACMRRVCEFAKIDFHRRSGYTRGRRGQPQQLLVCRQQRHRSVLTRYRDACRRKPAAYLEANCLLELFWREPQQPGPLGDLRASA